MRSTRAGTSARQRISGLRLKWKSSHAQRRPGRQPRQRRLNSISLIRSWVSAQRRLGRRARQRDERPVGIGDRAARSTRAGTSDPARGLRSSADLGRTSPAQGGPGPRPRQRMVDRGESIVEHLIAQQGPGGRSLQRAKPRPRPFDGRRRRSTRAGTSAPATVQTSPTRHCEHCPLNGGEAVASTTAGHSWYR